MAAGDEDRHLIRRQSVRVALAGARMGRQPRIDHRQVRRGKRELNFARHDLQTLAWSNVTLGVEIADLPSNVNCQLLAINRVQRPYAADTITQRCREGLAPDPDRAEYTYPGNDHTARHVSETASRASGGK